jgi:hypothetical protein
MIETLPEIQAPDLSAASYQRNAAELMARPRGFEPLTSASGGSCSLRKLNHYNASVSEIYACAYCVAIDEC